MRGTTIRWHRRVRLVLLALPLAIGVQLAAQITETPDTIAPGRIRIKMDGLRLSMDRADAAGNTYDALAIASTIVSAGITDSLDVQVGFDVFHRQSFSFRGVDSSDSGIGNSSFRFKWTFWRNRQLGAALAVIPYIKLPTGSSAVGSDSVEGGVILPWAMQIGGLTAGAMFQWDVLRNDADDGYDSLWRASGFVQRPLLFGLSVYGEAALEANSGGGSTGQMGVGALAAPGAVAFGLRALARAESPRRRVDSRGPGQLGVVAET